MTLGCDGAAAALRAFPATRSQPSSDPVNASADLTVSVFRAPVMVKLAACKTLASLQLQRH